jgi:hypothetical protein
VKSKSRVGPSSIELSARHGSLTKSSTLVIDAYAATMKLTFAQGIVTAAFAFILIVFLKLPKLSNKPLEVALAE